MASQQKLLASGASEKKFREIASKFHENVKFWNKAQVRGGPVVTPMIIANQKLKYNIS